ncbi:MAG: hypothetical protein N2654_00645 [Deltaproteobacteria bacterium]|nr:hypothetical protein [Deltaproteobacteria bacterium]
MEKFLNELGEVLAKINRSFSDIGLVVVSKGRETDLIKSVYETLKNYNFKTLKLGENYLGELKKKLSYLSNDDFHYIGVAKTRILESLIRLGVFVESVQSVKQLNILKSAGLSCFIQVNISRDPRKSGFFLEDAKHVIMDFRQTIQGVMVILNQDLSPSEKLKQFEAVRNAFPDLIMSAGMSDDWEEAIKAGSDILRIGRLLFE